MRSMSESVCVTRDTMNVVLISLDFDRRCHWRLVDRIDSKERIEPRKRSRGEAEGGNDEAKAQEDHALASSVSHLDDL